MSSLSKKVNSRNASNFAFDSKFFMIISISLIAISGGPLFAGITFGVWGIQGVFYANAFLTVFTMIIFNFLFNYKNRTHVY
jgi:1,4-dihydroxy-2-naphthoate octaprenyltransferase